MRAYFDQSRGSRNSARRLHAADLGMHEALVSEPENTSEAVRRIRGNLPLRTRAAERRWLEMYEGEDAARNVVMSRTGDTDWSRQCWP